MTDTTLLERPRIDGSAAPRNSMHIPTSRVERAGTAQPGEYLSFRLGAEDYGIAILDVKEIRSFEKPTRMADAPRVVLGVLNLRGSIVPIVDLRQVFDCASNEVGPLTVVIVLGLGEYTLGVVVDAVSDVVNVAGDQLRPPPALGGVTGASARAITGLACLEGKQGDPAQSRMVLLLDAQSLADIVRPTAIDQRSTSP